MSTTTQVVLLPDKGEEEKEHHYSMTIFFILLVLGKVTLLHFLFVYLHLFDKYVCFDDWGLIPALFMCWTSTIAI